MALTVIKELKFRKNFIYKTESQSQLPLLIFKLAEQSSYHLVHILILSLFFIFLYDNKEKPQKRMLLEKNQLQDSYFDVEQI